MINNKFDVIFRGMEHAELAPLMALTKDGGYDRLVTTQGMPHHEIHRAFEVLDLISAEFRSDPMSVQCFDLRLVKKTNELVDTWNKLGRP